MRWHHASCSQRLGHHSSYVRRIVVYELDSDTQYLSRRRRSRSMRLIVGHATMRCQSAAPSDKNQCNCKCVRRASVAQKRKGTRLTGAINLGRPQKSQMSRGDWCPHRVPYRGQVSGSSGECTRNGHWNGSWPRSISIKLIATARRSRLIHSPHLFLEGM